MSRLNSLVQRSTESSHLQVCNIFAKNTYKPDCYNCQMFNATSCIQMFPRYFIKDILKNAPL